MKKITIISDANNALEGWFATICLNKALAPSGIEIDHVCTTIDDKSKRVIALSEETIETLMSLGLQQQHLFNRSIANLWLADRFTNWSLTKRTFYQTQSPIGVDKEGLPFHHFLMPLLRQDNSVDLSDFSLTASAAKLGKYVLPSQDPKSILSSVNVGLNVEVGYLTNILRQLALHLGVTERVGDLASVTTQQSLITDVTLTSGQSIESDFYFDLCQFTSNTPLRNHDDADKLTPFTDYKPLQCITTVEQAKSAAMTPVTKYIKTGVGWQRTVRLGQNRYTETYQHGSIESQSSEAAWSQSVSMSLVNNAWQGNCVKLGSSALDMIDMFGLRLSILNQQIVRWCRHFPVNHDSSALSRAFNLENSRSNMVHLVMSQLPFLSTSLPLEDLEHSPSYVDFELIEDGQVLVDYLSALFINTGTFPELENQIKKSYFWIAFMVNMGLTPKVCAPQVERMSQSEVRAFVDKVKQKVGNTANALR